MARSSFRCKPDDPLLCGPGSPTNFMVLTRATNRFPVPTASSAPPTTSTSNENTTSPFVDQNQTYYVASVAPGVPARL